MDAMVRCDCFLAAPLKPMRCVNTELTRIFIFTTERALFVGHKIACFEVFIGYYDISR